ncbi:hypothetical protein [Kingella negevensis]|nr:hypothetical protein [Kingella negevensis]MDK4689479.1 hypothetical protein [Kingella negevensis]WII90205.1 hypothetical protein QEO93_06900 [Kingella negevensis]
MQPENHFLGCIHMERRRFADTIAARSVLSIHQISTPRQNQFSGCKIA